jgi:hypothetical protein
VGVDMGGSEIHIRQGVTRSGGGGQEQCVPDTHVYVRGHQVVKAVVMAAASISISIIVLATRGGRKGGREEEGGRQRRPSSVSGTAREQGTHQYGWKNPMTLRPFADERPPRRHAHARRQQAARAQRTRQEPATRTARSSGSMYHGESPMIHIRSELGS